MKKEELRREFFKLREQGITYSKCKILLASQHSWQGCVRTLERWSAKLETGQWDLQDASRRPIRTTKKLSDDLVERICTIRKRTGWGQDKIKQRYPNLPVSAMTIKRVIKQQGLARAVKLRGKRIKWVRWQRQHPNSLWQVDHSDDQDESGKWTLSILDDNSRYSLGLPRLTRVTTDAVTCILDELIRRHGKPREILTDSGSAYGGTSKHSKFDRWCRKRGIIHIRAHIHSPTTCGKVERLFQTIDQELPFCNNDQELFRLRYNHNRPHASLNGKTPAQIYFGR
jgi:transposase InsO family protein